MLSHRKGTHCATHHYGVHFEIHKVLHFRRQLAQQQYAILPGHVHVRVLEALQERRKNTQQNKDDNRVSLLIYVGCGAHQGNTFEDVSISAVP